MKIVSGLYIVSTPIGNLEDITIRALNILRHSDTIFCEDTRTTQKLLQKYEICDKKLAIYNDHSDIKTRKKIIEMIQNGKVVSLVSDAGTPLISDPGYKLVRHIQEEKLFFDVIPGACAAIAALLLSGLPTDRFYFVGFLPKTYNSKVNALKKLSSIDSTIILYETALRAKDTLLAINESLGNREVAIVREISKLYQETARMKVREMIDEDKIKYKGEFVILIGSEVKTEKFDEEALYAEIKILHNQGTSKKNIAENIISRFHNGLSKNDIYKICAKILSS